MKLTDSRRRIRGIFIGTVALATISALGGCAGGGGESAGDMRDITVGVLTSLDIAPVYLAEQEGFFEEEGLNVTYEVAQGGAALVPAVVSGQYQFGFSNLVSVMVARDKGLPLQVVQAGSQSTNEAPDWSAIVVAADSPLQTAADLEGKTIAVNTLGANGELTVRESIRKAGGDPDQADFVELSFADMIAAVSSGAVDAAFAVEPFLALHEDAGNRPLTWNYLDVGINTTSGVYISAETTDAALVNRFVSAMEKAQDFAQENPDAVRAIVPTFSDMDPALVERVVLPAYPAEVSLDSVQILADLAYDDGFVSKPVDLDALIRDE